MIDYWKRPYRARVEGSDFAGTFCFDTLQEALRYLTDYYATVGPRIARTAGHWAELNARRSYIAHTPDGIELWRVTMREFIGDSITND